MENYCKNFKAILTAIDTSKSTRLIVRTRCKMWSCPYCAEKNRNIWRAKIIDHINKNKDLSWSWFTLTSHSKKRGVKQSLKNLRGAWDTLMKRIKRKYASIGKIHYCRVFERHKDGSYHLHCIISLHWDSLKIRKSKDKKETSYDAWLSKQAKDVKLGYYTHAANFDGQHAGYIAGYVTKYMTKLSPEFSAELGRVRHIQTSQVWSKNDEKNELAWDIKHGYYEKNMIDDINARMKVLDLQTGLYITFDEFEDTYVYPPEFDHRRIYDDEK